MAKKECKNGCPPGVDMRSCEKMLNHTCPLMTWQGDSIIIGHKQKSLFN